MGETVHDPLLLLQQRLLLRHFLRETLHLLCVLYFEGGYTACELVLLFSMTIFREGPDKDVLGGGSLGDLAIESLFVRGVHCGQGCVGSAVLGVHPLQVMVHVLSRLAIFEQVTVTNEWFLLEVLLESVVHQSLLQLSLALAHVRFIREGLETK